ncbi:concanavalin A-like lectin/glucanase [Sarocladium strictum]
MASNVNDCDCGFIDSNDSTKSTFTNFFAVDFASVSQEQFDEIFIPATYQIPRANGPFNRNFFAEQVRLTKDGLDLTVSPPSNDEYVPCAQIFSRGQSFLYGSYHARIRVTDIPGTVTGFFNYKSDQSEVDIEHVSAWAESTLLYTVKPQIYTDSGNPDNSTYTRQPLREASSKNGVHEWSFIWLPDVVHFGIGGEYKHSLTINVPSAPGRLALNQWSDGNANYSLGPPKENSTSTVTFLWTIYNTTEEDSNPACQKATSPCAITDGLFQPRGGSETSGESDTSAIIDINNSERLTSAAGDLGSLGPSWFLMFFFCYLCL